MKKREGGRWRVKQRDRKEQQRENKFNFILHCNSLGFDPWLPILFPKQARSKPWVVIQKQNDEISDLRYFVDSFAGEGLPALFRRAQGLSLAILPTMPWLIARTWGCCAIWDHSGRGHQGHTRNTLELWGIHSVSLGRPRNAGEQTYIRHYVSFHETFGDKRK